MNTKILTSILAIGVAAAMLGTGTFAYFSDTVESDHNTFTAGTLSMAIQDSDEGPTTNPVYHSWESPVGWEPGQSFESTVYVTNTGTMDINLIAADWTNPTGDLNMLDHIFVTKWSQYTAEGWIDYLLPFGSSGLQDYASLVRDGTAPFTLRELMESYIPSNGEPSATNPGAWVVNEFGWWVAHQMDNLAGMGYDPVVGPALPVGQPYAIYMEFTFDPLAGNEFQGATCGFDLVFFGCQDLSQIP
jgi:predicted ribosomally synthesized peptide with SipW-like signal peptide